MQMTNAHQYFACVVNNVNEFDNNTSLPKSAYIQIHSFELIYLSTPTHIEI